MSSINRTCSICDNLWPTRSVNEWPRTCEATPTPQENRPIRPIIIQYRHPSKPTSVIIVRSYDIYFFQRPSKTTASAMTIQYQHPKKPTAYSYKKLVHTISSFSTPLNKTTTAAAILIKNKITGNKGDTIKMCLFAVGVGAYGRYKRRKVLIYRDGQK